MLQPRRSATVGVSAGSSLGFVLLASLLFVAVAPRRVAGFEPGDWHNTIAVELDTEAHPDLAAAADRLAHEHGLKNLGPVGTLPGVFWFKHVANASVPSLSRSRRSEQHHQALSSSHGVKHVEQQRVLRRTRRDISVPDPLYKNQWHLHNPNGHHINVQEAWSQGVTGKGVVVTVVDDGIEHDHPDLKDNYDAAASTDLNSHDDDPYPREEDPINKHGTRCSGEIAAAKNSYCGIGVAFDSHVGGVRMLDGIVTDAVEAGSLSLNPTHIDIYTNSWGPNDDGRVMEGPAKLAQAAFSTGITQGRGGKGCIYLFASGNGGRYGDNCNADGYANHKYVISIGAVSERDQSPWYVEPCAAALAVTYSSGSGGEPAITTTDLHKGCTSSHSGTSAAAPIAAGVYALVLSANPELTWRDVKHLTVKSAQVVSPNDDEWYTNAAGHKVHHRFAFGKLDAGRIVTMAKTWKNVPAQVVETPKARTAPQDIPHGTTQAESLIDSLEVATSDIATLEFVQVYIRADCEHRGDLVIELICPSGTPSTLLTKRTYDNGRSVDWTFMTSRCWDESPLGTWKLLMRNTASVTRQAKLLQWSLTLYGIPARGDSECSTGKYRNNHGDCEECDALCGDKGCTGPGPHKCLSCKNHIASDGTCVASCSDVEMYGEVYECQPCHAECVHGCTGPTAYDCTSCAHEKEEDGQCVPKCQPGEYANDSDECLPCDSECDGCTGPGPANCVSCKHFEYVTTSSDPTHAKIGLDGQHHCAAECPPGTFQFDEHICKQCDPQCLGCTGETAYDCTACVGLSVDVSAQLGRPEAMECVATCPSTFEPNGDSECVCPEGTYRDAASHLCMPCADQCADGGCSGPKADVQTCNKGCRELQAGDECVEVCPSGTFQTTDAKLVREATPSNAQVSLCAPCHESCLAGCSGPLPSDCLDCLSFKQEGACVEDCSDNYYEDGEKNCLPCHEQCDPTAGCTGPAASDCLKCKHAQTDGVCTDNCSPGTYLVETVSRCASCHQQCLVCFGPDNSQCFAKDSDASESAVKPACRTVTVGRRCEERCPQGFYVDGASKECKACDPQCGGSCTGAGSSVEACAHACANFEHDGQCVAACPDGVYADTVAQQCRVCDASCGDHGCDGPGPESCLKCEGDCPAGQQFDSNCACKPIVCGAGQVSDGHHCLDACPTGQYADGRHVCQPCHTLCAQHAGCSGPEASDCKACREVRLNGNGACAERCPDGSYEDDGGVCRPCHDECVKCSGPGAHECQVCKHLEYAEVGSQQSKCVAECPVGTFVMEDIMMCAPCSSQCKGGCTGKGPSNCAACAHVKQDKECVAECQAGHFANALGECLPCHAECVGGCSGPNPDECDGSGCVHYTWQTLCVDECPVDTYHESGSRECVACSDACAKGHGCSGPLPEHCSVTSTTTPKPSSPKSGKPTEPVIVDLTDGRNSKVVDGSPAAVFVGIVLAIVAVSAVFYWKRDSLLRSLGFSGTVSKGASGSPKPASRSRYRALKNNDYDDDDEDSDSAHAVSLA